MSEGGEPLEAATAAGPSHDTVLAIRNAIILSASLVATWSVALVVRFFLPRSLGPELFGAFSFADTLAASAAVIITFGVDTYVQKEIPARPEHASDFMGGVIVARALANIAVLAGMECVVLAMHRSVEVQLTVLVFGLGQLATTNANTFAALLQSSRTVGRLAAFNVVSKILWAGGVGLALALHLSLPAFACAFLVSEVTRAFILLGLVRKKLGLTLSLNRKGARDALRASLPFYVSSAAVVLYAKIDISIMAAMTTDIEVGWYGSAGNIAGIAMLLSPLMGWVLTPQLSRAAARAEADLLAMFRRSLELLIALAIPVSMMMGLAADVIIPLVFGAAFAPAIPALQILSWMFVLTYLAMLTATVLIMMGRGWTLTLVSIGSVLLNAALNLVIVRPALHALGQGGAGTAAAAISVGTELCVAITMLCVIGRRAFDARNLIVFAKSIAACLIVVAMHIAIASWGPVRILLDMIVYAALVVGTRAVRVGELYQTVRAAISRRGNDAKAISERN